jgi:hypothetical protein
MIVAIKLLKLQGVDLWESDTLTEHNCETLELSGTTKGYTVKVKLH